MSDDQVRTMTLRFVKPKFEFLEAKKKKMGARSWEAAVLKAFGYPED